MTEPQDILELFGKRPLVIKPGLTRTLTAWEILGRPGSALKTVLIAGTNGKGSTSGILWHLLSAAGFKVGHFSSPHLVEFRERINLSHKEVTNDQLVKEIRRLKVCLPKSLWEELTFFEINTLLALIIFEDAGVDFNIMEVGLGGRLDSTNIVDPCLSVITNIGLDHMAYLGETTALIAREKAGIMRSGISCIWGGAKSSDSHADTVIQVVAKELNCNLKVADRDFSDGQSEELFVKGHSPLIWPPKVAKWPSFLRGNFAMACAAFVELIIQQEYPMGESQGMVARAIEQFGAQQVKWPVTLVGRFQTLKIRKDGCSRELLLDVCHNPHGAVAFAQGLEETGIATIARPKPAFVSILADKDANGIWDALKEKVSEVARFQISSERSWTAGTKAVPGQMHASFGEAFQVALLNEQWSKPENQPWLVCGSVAAIGEVLSWLRIEGWLTDQIFE